MSKDKIVELAASDWNMQQINSQELERHLDCSFEAGSNIILIGHRGLGKTSIAKQRILSNGMIELYINLSMFERADLMGYAKLFNQDDKDEFLDFKMPRMFKPLFYGDKKVVILFDEADKADSSLHAPLLEIVQLHTINGRALPNLQSCVLTGNLISEGGNRLISPLLDRSEVYLLEPNVEMWLKWAAQNNIHSSVYAFIYDNANMLCSSNDISENYSDKSPRGWHLSSNIISYGEAKGWDKSIILQKIAGFVGKAAATQYEAYYSHYKTLLPLVDKVFKGESIKTEYNKLEPLDQFMACIVVGSKFANKLDQLNPQDEQHRTSDLIKNVGKFLTYSGDENIMATIRSQITQKRLTTWLLHKNEHWDFINNLRAEAYGK